tara:strand:- start:956 stop:1078 length:123 start_codon:yes stop_codon:yes gene_type:complete
MKGPKAITMIKGMASGRKVASKNGGPTETFAPVKASRKIG